MLLQLKSLTSLIMINFPISPSSLQVRDSFLCIAFAALFFTCRGRQQQHDDDQQVYIVYMGELPRSNSPVTALHTNMLLSTVGSRASEVLLYSYKRSFNGFVARLTEQEKDILANMDGVVSVFPNGKKELHTTSSWDFIGFPQNVKTSTIESDVIIGMIDTGIWPESESFNDSGYGPPPAKWKGKCFSSSNFTCNNKIIGGKHYRADGEVPEGAIASPRDSKGHGSHTASTAAGNIVSHASLLGLAEGTARGGVPSARLSIYKICWDDGCYDADILAAFDDAIADGVDIISLSIGGTTAIDYFEDSIAIGAFHSMKNGILTSNSVGNDGPHAQSISNVSPWSLSVAANAIDRKFIANVKLGNDQVFEGIAINTFQMNDTTYPLVWGGSIPNTKAGFTTEDSRYCTYDTMDTTKTKGTILLCDGFSTTNVQYAAGAAGTVMRTNTNDNAFAYLISASNLDTSDSAEVLHYIKTTSNPTAIIQKSIEGPEKRAPFVVSFSSRGPNRITPDILKPDITAPGVDILAAWSKASTVTEDDLDTRVVPYNIISGTSMSCPHASGAAAYVKSFHANWSPSAIKSALMTSATVLNATKNTDAEFAYGAGQINPIKATDPGLIYDLGEIDYVNFLCGQGYNTARLRVVTGDNSVCSDTESTKVWDLNYPAFTLSTDSGSSVTRVFHRTVTNVGSATSTYKAIVADSTSLKIIVEPDVLSFTSVGQKLTFNVTVTAQIKEKIKSGSLIWDDGVHQVRSPIVAHSYAQYYVSEKNVE